MRRSSANRRALSRASAARRATSTAELDVVVGVGRRAAEAHEAQHADRAPAGDERHRQRSGVAGAGHQLEVLLVDRERAQALGSDLVLQVRAARAGDDGDGVRPRGIERVAHARGVQHLQRARVGGVGRRLAERAVVHEIHDAQLGHVGHGHPHDLAQHRLGLGRRVEQLPGPCHEVRAPARRALVEQRLLVAAPALGGEHGQHAAGGDRRHLADVLGREEPVVGEPQRDRAGHGQQGDAERAARRREGGGHQRPDDQQRHEDRAVAQGERERGVDEHEGRPGRCRDARPSPHRTRS